MTTDSIYYLLLFCFTTVSVVAVCLVAMLDAKAKRERRQARRKERQAALSDLSRAVENGDWDEVLRVLPKARALTANFVLPEAFFHIEFAAHYNQGETAATAQWAAEQAEGPLVALPYANSIVNTLIHVGRYAKALEYADRHLQAPGDHEGERDEDHLLIRINRAEALYNLGRWDEALASLEGVEGPGETAPIVLAGVRCQRAWILAHLGRAEEAKRQLDDCDRGGLPANYWSEFHYTWAVTWLGLGRVGDARAEAQRGLDVAQRMASTRNGQFLLARVARAEGSLLEARELLEAGANHPYRGQGGDGLLLWGDIMNELGSPEGASKAWSLAVERDAESESAAAARDRLRSGGLVLPTPSSSGKVKAPSAPAATMQPLDA